MKKIVFVLSIFLVTTLGANAYVDNMYMTTEKYMVNTGYSKEMARAMTITNQDPYREPYKAPPVNILKRISNYIAPTTFTDLNFYNHNINSNNTSFTDY